MTLFVLAFGWLAAEVNDRIAQSFPACRFDSVRKFHVEDQFQ